MTSLRRKYSEAFETKRSCSFHFNSKKLIKNEKIANKGLTNSEKICKSVGQFIKDNKLDLNLSETTIAAFVVSTDEISSPTVVSFGTGNGNIESKPFLASIPGERLLDTHAEVVARRGFELYLYENLLALQKNSDSDKFLILQKHPNGNGYCKKPEIKISLFTSKIPCGDALRENAKIKRGLLQKKFTEIPELRCKTIPLLENYKFTQDGLITGVQYCLFNSCSDKIAKWNVVGVQGALLSMYIEPIYLDSIVIAKDESFVNCELRESFYGRIDNNLLHSKLSSNNVYKLHRPRIELTQENWLVPNSALNETSSESSTSKYSINWQKSLEENLKQKNFETVISKTGAVLSQQDNSGKVSRLSKKSFMKLYINLAIEFPNMSKSEQSQKQIPPYFEYFYVGLKTQAVHYQNAKTALKETFKEINLGCWLEPPLQNEFIPFSEEFCKMQ